MPQNLTFTSHNRNEFNQAAAAAANAQAGIFPVQFNFVSADGSVISLIVDPDTEDGA